MPVWVLLPHLPLSFKQFSFHHIEIALRNLTT